MIIARYLGKEVLQTTLVVTGILLVIVMSGRFVKYLAEAAAGKMDATVLFTIMFYRLPGFLELILPFGFFVSVLLVYGRLYADSEMTVLFACGVSRRRLIVWTYLPALLIVLIIAALSLWLTPLGLQKSEGILAQQQSRNHFDTLQPARFQIMGKQNVVTYAEDIENRQQARHFFLANTGIASDQPLMSIRAEVAEQVIDEYSGEMYLLFRRGIQYQGRPGQANYRQTSFAKLAYHIKPPVTVAVSRNEVNRLSTFALLQSQSLLSHKIALHWRLSSPILVLVITLFAVIFSYTNPRHGRYAMLIPAFFLYLLYLTLLSAVRGYLEAKAGWPVFVLWSVHFAFMLVGLLLLNRQYLLASLLRASNKYAEQKA